MKWIILQTFDKFDRRRKKKQKKKCNEGGLTDTKAEVVKGTVGRREAEKIDNDKRKKNDALFLSSFSFDALPHKKTQNTFGYTWYQEHSYPNGDHFSCNRKLCDIVSVRPFLSYACFHSTFNHLKRMRKHGIRSIRFDFGLKC